MNTKLSGLEIKWPPTKKLEKYLSRGFYIVRPAEMWELMFGSTADNTNELAKLGRVLEAKGWVRSARRGNLVFKMSVEDYASQN